MVDSGFFLLNRKIKSYKFAQFYRNNKNLYQKYIDLQYKYLKLKFN